MKNQHEYRKIYKAILDALDGSPRTRAELIGAGINAFSLSPAELADRSTNGRQNVIRSMCGTVINEMQARSIILFDENKLYKKTTEKPIAIRIERCEEKIIEALQKKPMTSKEIRDRLVRIFKTDTTATERDDNKLFTYIGQVLKTLTAEKIITFDGSIYKIAQARTAEVKNRQEILTLKSEFLSAIHSRGGEFFEHYFMNLLEKHFIRSGKKVVESYVTGGSDDGGIDGIIKTIDTLGFRETIMVQTKNRNDTTSETDVRGFYGAVCAAQGSRGIFAVNSDFHPMAKKLLDSIDNCVGINGDKLFTMAADCGYGIKRAEGKLAIDLDSLE